MTVSNWIWKCEHVLRFLFSLVFHDQAQLIFIVLSISIYNNNHFLFVLNPVGGLEDLFLGMFCWFLISSFFPEFITCQESRNGVSSASIFTFWRDTPFIGSNYQIYENIKSWWGTWYCLNFYYFSMPAFSFEKLPSCRK